VLRFRSWRRRRGGHTRCPCAYGAASREGGPLGADRLLTFFDNYAVSSWRPDHANRAAELVDAAQTVEARGQVFNPEGGLEDCWDAQSAYFDQGGAFLVVTRDGAEDGDVLGCAAVTLGDEVALLASGASTSDPQRTTVAAIRRLCLAPGTPPALADFLLRVMERLAVSAAGGACTEAIALGWEAGGPSGMALDAAVLRAGGYEPTGRLSFQAGGVSLEELCKPLSAEDAQLAGRAARGAEEMIEVISNDGTPLGVYPRQVVERHNLLHAAIGCLVLDDEGRIYVHQRSPAKSVHPSRFDMYVGGLVVAGESPEEAARCELQEELGIAMTMSLDCLEPTFVTPFMGKRNRVLVHCFKMVLPAGFELKHQDGEVVWGDWMAPNQLAKMIAAEEFVPGGLAMWEETLRRGIVSLGGASSADSM